MWISTKFCISVFHSIAEEIEITYSYWDGSGHRRHVLQMKKGDSIHRFLAKVLESIRKEFPELRCVDLTINSCFVYHTCCCLPIYRAVNVDNLMYIKEDLIIPHVKNNLATFKTF